VNHERVAVAEYDRALEAAVSAGCEVIVPIRPLDLLNDVTQKPWPVRVAFFRGPDGELIDSKIRRATPERTGFGAIRTRQIPNRSTLAPSSKQARSFH